MSKHTPALTVWQDATAPGRSFVDTLRALVGVALLVALLALSLSFQQVAGTRSNTHVAATAQSAMADGPMWGCGGAPIPC